MRFAKQIVPAFLLCISTSILIVASPGKARAQASPPPADKAQIVFLRPKQGLGSDVAAQLLEVKDDRPQLIAQLGQEDKFTLETTPGSKKFMSLGRSGDLLFANVLGGKTYYVVLRYNPGNSGFALLPVQATGRFRRDSPLVVDGIKTYRPVTLTVADRDRFHQANSGFIQTEYERVSASYAGKSASQLAERTLLPEGGGDDPIRAATPANPASAAAESPSARRLKELQLLLDKGLITTDEYQEKRKAILKDL
jgi:hypothetical protein